VQTNCYLLFAFYPSNLFLVAHISNIPYSFKKSTLFLGFFEEYCVFILLVTSAKLHDKTRQQFSFVLPSNNVFITVFIIYKNLVTRK
jgi:hypothetical protein